MYFVFTGGFFTNDSKPWYVTFWHPIKKINGKNEPFPDADSTSRYPGLGLGNGRSESRA